MSGFTLRVERGPDAGRALAIPPDGGVIGRQAGVELALTDPLISRRHARVDLRDGRESDRRTVDTRWICLYSQTVAAMDLDGSWTLLLLLLCLHRSRHPLIRRRVE